MIVVIGGQKGGTGKSTTATNFSAMRALNGKDCVLYDVNYHQMNSLTWCSIRDELDISPRIMSIGKSTKFIGKDLIELDKKFSDVIADCGGIDDEGFRASLTVAHVFVSCLKPSQFDIWSLGKIDAIIKEAKKINPKLKAFLFINLAPTNPFEKDAEKAIQFIKEAGFQNFELIDRPVRDRKVFEKVIPLGLSVIEYEPRDEKAISEIKNIYDHIFKD